MAYVSADNLGSQEVGGFKIGSAARFKCRECMGSANDITAKVRIVFFLYKVKHVQDKGFEVFCIKFKTAFNYSNNELSLIGLIAVP